MSYKTLHSISACLVVLTLQNGCTDKPVASTGSDTDPQTTEESASEASTDGSTSEGSATDSTTEESASEASTDESTTDDHGTGTDATTDTSETDTDASETDATTDPSETETTSETDETTATTDPTTETETDTDGTTTDTGGVDCPAVPGFNCDGPVNCDQGYQCGELSSPFDADGCLRPSCESDEDCQAGDRCYIGYEFDDCLSSEVFCGQEGDMCECGSSDDCGGAFCVPEDIYPG